MCVRVCVCVCVCIRTCVTLCVNTYRLQNYVEVEQYIHYYESINLQI